MQVAKHQRVVLPFKLRSRMDGDAQHTWHRVAGGGSPCAPARAYVTGGPHDAPRTRTVAVRVRDVATSHTVARLNVLNWAAVRCVVGAGLHGCGLGRDRDTSPPRPDPPRPGPSVPVAVSVPRATDTQQVLVTRDRFHQADCGLAVFCLFYSAPE